MCRVVLCYAVSCCAVLCSGLFLHCIVLVVLLGCVAVLYRIVLNCSVSCWVNRNVHV